MSKRKNASDENLCPIASDPRKRLTSDAQTDAIKANFPKGIARPALRALVAAGFTTLEHLTTVTKDELSELHGMGPKAVNTLHAGLLEKGLDFQNSSEGN